MSEGPKRLLEAPGIADPGLGAQLRSDLRIAKDAPAGYDVEGGLARFSATIGGGSVGDHKGGGSGSGGQGAGSGTGGALGLKLGVAGLLALGALGGAIAVGSARKATPPTSAAETSALPAAIASSTSSIDEPPTAPRALEPAEAAASTSPLAAGSRGAASAAPSAGLTIKPEMDQLAETRRALASDPGRALALAEEGRARFPRGIFGQEREALAISALMKLGRSSEAKERARAFVTRHPESPIAEGLRGLAEGD